jgi:cytochrome c oxidase subunit 2
VRFVLQSKDVLHDFWVPAFRMKKDVVPGIEVSYRVTPNRTGRFPIVCAELCGLGHAVMRSSAVVEEQQAFDSWLAKLGQPAAPPAGGTAGGGETDGKAIFTAATNNCGACHTLAEAGTKGTIGPDLDKVLADKDEAFIKQSIVDPDKVIADGYQSGIMPPNFSQTIPPAQLDALVKYLSEVTKGG